HRSGVGGLGCPQLLRRQRPWGVAEASGGDPLRARPVDEPTSRDVFHPPAEDRRGGTEGRAAEEPRLPDAVVAPGRTIAPSRPSAAHEATAASSTASTSPNVSPNRRSATDRKASKAPAAGWTWEA